MNPIEVHISLAVAATMTGIPQQYLEDCALLGLLDGTLFVQSYPQLEENVEGSEPLRDAMERLNALVEERGVDPRKTIMVGDSSVDILTARNAGTWSCGVSWGFQPYTLKEVPPDLLIDDMRQLSSLVCEP